VAERVAERVPVAGPARIPACHRGLAEATRRQVAVATVAAGTVAAGTAAAADLRAVVAARVGASRRVERHRRRRRLGEGLQLADQEMIHDIQTGAELPRVGTAPHWERYNRAVQDVPGVIDALVTAIELGLEEQLSRDRSVNSSWLGSHILDTFAERTSWRRYVGDADASSTLFGMILWTVISDDDRSWLSSLTKNATPHETNRVYWLRP
jgi:hypothetical protein